MKVQPEDLMEMVITADARRNPQVEQTLARRYPRWKRALIEPFFNTVGVLLGQLLAWAPWPLRWRSDRQIAIWLGARPNAQPAEFDQRREELIALARELRQQTGVRPAAFVLTSHPPTVGPFEWLRFELVREGLALGNAVVDAIGRGFYPGAPQCFLAIDPYALDTVPRPVAGLYSGFMHRIYLVWDRQSRTQSALQRHLLLRHTGYRDIGWRLLRTLRRGAPVVMVLGGGLPSNARLFYAAREFIRQLPWRNRPISRAAAQQRWMQAVIEPAGPILPYANGELPEATRRRLGECLSAWGITEADQPGWVERFAEEFAQTVPNRERLFRVLLSRIVRCGQPLLLIAVAHQEQNPLIRISEPWAIYQDAAGSLRLLRGASRTPEPVDDIPGLARRFARCFTFNR
jgi:hypothetical protein